MIAPSAQYITTNDQLKRTPVYRIRLSLNTSPISTVEFTNLPIRANYDDVILEDGPSLYLRLGESSGSTAVDSSGNGLDGTYQNTPTLGVAGAIVKDANTAVTLNGTNESITVADDPLLDPGDTLTLEAWVFPTDNSNGYILAKGSGGYLLYRDASGFLAFAKQGTGNIVFSTATFALSAWTHVVATKSGSAVKLYINGVDVTGTVSNQTIVGTADPLTIGSDGGGLLFYTGSIDEVAIYPTALSPSRVRAHYSAGLMLLNKGGANYDDTVLSFSPSAYWRLGESITSPVTTQATDSSGNGLHGVYTNTPTLEVPGAIVNDPDTAVALNGIDEWISVADDPLLDPGDTFTLMGWIKRTSSTDYYTIFDKGSNGYYLSVTSSGLLTLAKSNVANIVQSNSDVPIGVWTFVVATKSGSTVKLYINGVDVTGTVSNQTIAANAAALRIGQDYPGIFALASFDELAIFPTALTAADIRSIYVNRSGVYPYLRDLSGLTAQLEPERGRSSVGSLNFTIDDVGGVLTNLLADGVLNMSASLDCGYADIREADFVTDFYAGVLDSIRLNDGLTGYSCTLRSKLIRTNKKLFTPTTFRLRAAISGSPGTIDITDSRGAKDAGYFLVDQEVIGYTSKTEDGVQPWDNGVTTGISFALRAIGYGNGYWIAVAQPAYDSTGLIFKSTDLITWRQIPVLEDDILGAERIELYALAYNGTDTWVTVGHDSGLNSSVIFSSSDDGESWTRRSAASSGMQLKGVTWAGGTINKFFAVSGSGNRDQVQHSPDAEVWSQSTVSDKPWSCAAYSEDLDEVLIGALDGSIETFDGATWTPQTSAVASVKAALWASALGLWVTVGNSAIQTSPDSAAWTARTDPAGDHDSLAIAWAPGIPRLVAVGLGITNTIIYSADAITWTGGGTDSVASNMTGGIVFADGQFAVSSATEVPVSTTGLSTSWTVALSKLNGLSRGEAGTTSANHVINSTGKEAFYFPPAHPIDTLIEWLEGTEKDGLGIDASEIDIAGLDAIRDATPAYLAEWLILEEANGKTWIEDEINAVLGLYPKLSGKIGMHRGIAADAGDVVDSLTHKNMVFHSGGERPILGWDFSVASVYNVVVWNYDYDFLTGNFATSREFTDDASIERFGRKPLVISSKGLHTDLGATTIITEVSELLLARYANGVPRVRTRTHLQKHLFEPGDLIEVTSPLLPNRATGTRGITSGLMEIVDRSVVPTGMDGEVGVNFNLLDFSS